MELRHIESFLAIADERHFGRAAARLHVSQPSLSQHLQRLERSLGTRLVDRGPHRVTLTEAGEVFRAEASRLLGDLADAATLTRQVGAGQAGTVRVGFNYPAGRRVLPPTLHRLATRHPGLRPVLSEQRSGPQLAGVAAGELDVALVFGTPDDPGFAHRHAFRTPLVALVGAGHPLAGRADVQVAGLAEHPCVLFRRELSPASHDALTGAAAAAGVTLDVADEVDDSMATAMVVATGSVVGFASAARAADASSMGLTAVPIVDPEPVLDVSVVWQARGARPAARTFLSCVAIG
ncbi:MAG TPA: LysR family transcriptional regulator [Pseudonocardiaceae bacterium]|jgi:DNA-binding transcriptional LysR family regulator|nr:LysR family transcriptional regulator [Pseudonocardiaceae bacterium]